MQKTCIGKIPRRRRGYPLQYSGLENSVDSLIHGVANRWTQGLGAGGEGDDRGWDGWMASLTRWTWVWVNFRSWWWRGSPGVLWFMGSQRVGHDWVTELNWTEANIFNRTQMSQYGKWRSSHYIMYIGDYMLIKIDCVDNFTVLQCLCISNHHSFVWWWF